MSVWVKKLVCKFKYFFHFNLFYAITHPSWLNWSDKEALMKFIYYGGSQELFFCFITLFLFITIIGNFYQYGFL